MSKPIFGTCRPLDGARASIEPITVPLSIHGIFWQPNFFPFFILFAYKMLSCILSCALSVAGKREQTRSPQSPPGPICPPNWQTQKSRRHRQHAPCAVYPLLFVLLSLFLHPSPTTTPLCVKLMQIYRTCSFGDSMTRRPF